MVDLATISAQGHSTQVNSAYAGNFQTLLDKLTTSGYKIDSIGGYNYRNIAGTSTLSKHALGDALDINPAQNPVSYGGSGNMTTNIPNASVLASESGGLSWGGDWTHSKVDPMHFEVVNSTTPMDASGSADPQATDAGAAVDPKPLGYYAVGSADDPAVQAGAATKAAGSIDATTAAGAGSIPDAIIKAGNAQAETNAAATKGLASAISGATNAATAQNTQNDQTIMGWLGNRMLQIMVFVIAAIFLLIGLYMFSGNKISVAMPVAA